MKKLLNSPKFLILADQAVFSGSSFVLTLLVARNIEVAMFGLYSGYVLAVYLVVSAVSAWVIQPFQVLQGKADDMQAYTSFTIALQVILTVLACVFTLAVLVLVVPDVPLTVVLFGGGFMMHDFGRKLLLALDKARQTLFLDIVVSIGLFVATLAFISIGDDNIYQLLMFCFFTYLLSVALIFYFTKPRAITRLFFMSSLRQHFREGKWLFSTALVQWWSGNMFVVASGVYLGTTALGALRLGQSLFGVLNIVLQTFENYVLPQTALRLRISKEASMHYLGSISKKTALLFVPILILAFLFGTRVMVLAGGVAYADFGFVVQGLAVLYVLVFLNQPIRIIIRSLLFNKHFFYGYVISLVFALSFSHVLLSNFELTGAIIGLTVSQLILLVYWSIVLQQQKINLWKLFM
jgi:O-antigen/teichoic acid export membrane protein